jgi:hypothetical protein
LDAESLGNSEALTIKNLDKGTTEKTVLTKVNVLSNTIEKLVDWYSKGSSESNPCRKCKCPNSKSERDLKLVSEEESTNLGHG